MHIKLNKFLISLAIIMICFSSFSINNLKASAQTGLELMAKSAYLMDYESGTLIFAKNENERMPIASMTKIMLLLLAFEAEKCGEFSLDEQITVSKNASGMGGSQVFLEENGKYSAEDLIKSIIIASANDASVAIAERLYGSEQAAVDKMNEKCKILKLNNTLFCNCTGLMKPTQYSCAKDVALMLKELLKYEKYFNYSNIYLDEISHTDGRKTTLTNTNKLIKHYAGCDGGKTGFTNEAGFCLAATAKRGAMRVISVVINESDSKTRFKDVASMFDYAFDNYTSRAILSSKDALDIKAHVLNGKQEYVAIKPKRDLYIFTKKSEKIDVKIDFCPYEVKAPVIGNSTTLGKLIVYRNNIKIDEVDVVAFEDVKKMGYFDYVKEILIA